MTTSHPGVDTSHHNGPLDYHAMVAAGIEWTASKATEGATFVDDTFADHRARAHEVGMHLVLLYHFVHPRASIVDQITNFGNAVGDLAPNERLVLDIEPTPGVDEWQGFGPQASVLIVLALVTQLKQAYPGLKQSDVILYGSLGWLRGQFGDNLDELTIMPLWDARYGAPAVGDASPWPPVGDTSDRPQVVAWQNSEHGSVPGAGDPGQIDTDVWICGEAWGA